MEVFLNDYYSCYLISCVLNPSSAAFNEYLWEAPFGLVLLENDLGIIDCNEFAEKHLQKASGKRDLRGKNIIDMVGELAVFDTELREFREKSTTTVYRLSLPFEVSIMEYSFFRGPEGYTLLIQDQTREKELETNSIQSIIAGQENERRRLAREIHDGIAPLLSTAKLELDLFLEDLKEKAEDISIARLKNVRETIDILSTDLRDLSHRLIPRLLEEFGLYSALKNTISRINANSPVPVEFISNLDPDERLDHDIELNVFRCGQELLSNAIKHARASRIVIQVIKHENSVVLMVEDNGIGFDALEKSIHREGIGLTNVETRVRSLNGEFIIESEKDQGTLISIETPLRNLLKNQENGKN